MKKLNFIGKIEMIKKSMEVDFHSIVSVSDNNGNEVIPASEEPYPFLPENVYAVHNPILYKIFTLDTNQNGVSPTDFIKAYGDGFKEGLRFLENERIDIGDLDDKNKNASLLNRLKRILHERKFKKNKTILHLVFHPVKGVWTDKTIFEVGKYNGIVTAIDQFATRAGLDAKQLGKDEKKMPNSQLADFFNNIKDKQKFLKDLRDTFTTEIGIDFKILMELLKEEKILLIGNREFSTFHKLCKHFFNHDIGTKQSINDTYKHTEMDKEIYKPNIEIIESKLKPLIDRHKGKAT